MTDFLQYPVNPGDPCVIGLDPLGFDSLLSTVWKMNMAADVNGLVGLLRNLVPADEVVAELSLPSCVATMRDLGLLAGSAKRHGVEPVDAVPELEKLLLHLGARTQMIPRDTVHHYIGWNPTGRRERMYTGERMERMLMSSVRVTLSRLIDAVESCRRLEDLEPEALEFAVAANELVALLRSLEDAIDIVIANVTPEFFARTLRPYFEEIRVGGVVYLGPAAAHVPLALIDLALWASDCGDKDYDEFWCESEQYGLPQWRELYKRWAKGPSAVTRVTTALRLVPAGQAPPNLRASTEALCRALRALVVFRGKHFTVARNAYAEEIRLYPLGSGGGSLQLLEQVTALTRENTGLMRKSLNRSGSSTTSASRHRAHQGPKQAPGADEERKALG
ncbi:monodechloroaminopyrrolnitrin synthase PrnB family protein [Nocardia brevicatena]|uniref:monodechloroaminopyrrolnitrin synthase PrnB family protein n=1 Tax=Nocardia brevicatena TaxID=37327 RepID=UPI000313A1E2|nr:monodechloroaminopyrrolnitrin synthase PrnB family protein [Nocardia brevicatena]